MHCVPSLLLKNWNLAVELQPVSENTVTLQILLPAYAKNLHREMPQSLCSLFAGAVKKNKNLHLLSMNFFITACPMHCRDGFYAPFNPQGWLLPFHCYLALVYHNFDIMTLTVPFGSLRTLRATCSLLVLDEWWQWLLPWVNSVNCCHLNQQ